MHQALSRTQSPSSRGQEQKHRLQGVSFLLSSLTRHPSGVAAGRLPHRQTRGEAPEVGRVDESQAEDANGAAVERPDVAEAAVLQVGQFDGLTCQRTQRRRTPVITQRSETEPR